MAKLNKLLTPEFWENATPASVSDAIYSGADANARDEDGRTPLHFASENGNVALMETLIQCEKDECIKINARDNNGHTALGSVAYTTNNPKVIMTLLDFGADLHAHDDRGITPLDFIHMNEKLKSNLVDYFLAS